MRRPHMERRSRRYTPRQFVSDYETEPPAEGLQQVNIPTHPLDQIADTVLHISEPVSVATKKPTNPPPVSRVRYDPNRPIGFRLSSALGVGHELVENLIKNHIGEDPQREGLRETPKRYLEALKFWTSGYNQNPADILKTFQDGAQGYDEMIFQGELDFFSLCEHHICPFFGHAYIAYIPDGRIVGLSKLARLVEIFARRLQCQERMTAQIADALMENLQPIGAAVVLKCRHLCMESRGVQKVGTITTTSTLKGCFKSEHETRAEFMSLVANASKE